MGNQLNINYYNGSENDLIEGLVAGTNVIQEKNSKGILCNSKVQ